MAEDLKVLADGRKYNYVLNFTKWKDTVTKLKKKKKALQISLVPGLLTEVSRKIKKYYNE